MRTLLVVLSFFCTSSIFSQTTKPVPAVEHVIIISVDGMRPDVMLRADTPNLRGLMKRGSYSMWARTIPEAITLPSHTSMITGVSSRVHGINWNDDRPAEQRIKPKVPTLFQLARQAGLTSAILTGKTKFVAIAEDGVDHVYVTNDRDEKVATTAATVIASHKPNVVFVHLAQTDGMGHKIGWGTPEQVAIIEGADAAIGQVVAAVEAAGLTDSTVFIVSADHGGAGRGHGKDDARSRHIPWIIVGPEIRRDLDLTRFKELEINTQDTFATACWMLGIAVPAHSEGKPITQIIADQELLGAAPTTAPAPTTQPR